MRAFSCLPGIALAVTLATIDIPQALAGEIQWSIENNFRLLKDAQDQDWLKSLSLNSENPETSTVTLRDLKGHWSEVPRTFYNDASGLYEKDYINPTQWIIKVSSSTAPYGSMCEWKIMDKKIIGPCHDFVIPLKFGSSPVTVSAITPIGIEDKSIVQAKDVLFLAIGDSYASGEGQPDVIRDGNLRNASWWDRKCHRSLYSWPVLTAARFAQNHPHNSVTVVSRACSGALIDQLTNTNDDGGPGESSRKVNNEVMLAPQLTQVKRDLCLGKWINGECLGALREPDYILLSIGGNDAKFGTMVVDGLIHKVNKGIELDQKYVQDASNTVDKLTQKYPELASKINMAYPNSSVIMALYPDPLHWRPNIFCGRGTNGGLIKDDDDISPIDFTMNGAEELLAKITKKRITNQEVTALHDDFYTRFVGRIPLTINPDDNSSVVEFKNNRNYDYRGLLSIGKDLEKRYPKNWRLVVTNSEYKTGTNPFESEGEKRDTDQPPCYRPKGYCVPGNTVTGRWFNTITDSIDRIGNVYGAMHPNIYGQLYYVSKVYPALPNVKTHQFAWGLDPNNKLDPGMSCKVK